MRKLIFALAIFGIAVSALALQAHYSALPYGQGANWGSISHSRFSMLGPIPVAAIGVAGYLLLGLSAWFERRVWTCLLAWTGLGFASYLTYLEAFVLHAWCLYCVISQCLIVLIAILAVIELVRHIIKRISGTVSSAVDQVVTNVRYG